MTADPAAAGQRPPPGQPSWWPVAVVLAVTALTAVAVLVGLVGSGSDMPCGKACRGESPDSSAEAWLLGFLYVGLLALLSLARIFSETAGLSKFMPSYRGSLALLGVGSLLGAFLTPRSWIPLRPAFLVGGFGCLAILALAPRFARVLRPDPAA